MSVQFKFCRYNLGFVRWWTARTEQVPDATFMVDQYKLFPPELNKQTYYFVFMFQFIRVLKHKLLIFVILAHMCFVFQLFSSCFLLFARACITILYCGIILFFLVLVFVVRDQ